MSNRRLFFTVIIKLLVLSGMLVLSWVFISSLFSKDERVNIETSNDSSLAMVELGDMEKGQIKKVRWNNKEVAILLRQNPEKLNAILNIVPEENLHASINMKTRSIKPEYFVYFNSGDSNNCPLFYAASEFKDVCTSNKFDEAGRGLQFSPHNFFLKIPPHYFEKTQLIIGKWNPI